jgi:hypothetical protein
MATKSHEASTEPSNAASDQVDTLINIRRGELKRIFRHCGVPEIDILNRVEDILAERRRWSAAAREAY